MGQEFSLSDDNLNKLYTNRLSTETITQGEWTITVSKKYELNKKLHCLLVVTKDGITKTYLFAILVSPDNDDNNKYNMGNFINNYIRGFDKTPGLSAEDIEKLPKSNKLKL